MRRTERKVVNSRLMGQCHVRALALLPQLKESMSFRVITAPSLA